MRDLGQPHICRVEAWVGNRYPHPLTNFSIWESGICTMPGQHSGTDHTDLREGELAVTVRAWEIWSRLSAAMCWHGRRRDALSPVSHRLWQVGELALSSEE